MHKNKKSGLSGKEAADDVPSWAKGERPLTAESGREFAKRLLDDQYGAGNYPPARRQRVQQDQEVGRPRV